MAQLTLRVDEELVDQLKASAAAAGTSVNRWATVVLRAAVDPELEGEEHERVRARLRRAGLLDEPRPSVNSRRPDPAELEQAGRLAGRGRPLSDYVREERVERG